MIDTTKLTNTTVKAAFEAWQNGDAVLWRSFFEPDATLLDDGSSRDFHSFSTKTIGHEHFTSIDKVENNGKEIYGKFHTESWGDFKTYFKFHINNNGKFTQLEIGQAKY